jgi:hypothetical protein
MTDAATSLSPAQAASAVSPQRWWRPAVFQLAGWEMLLMRAGFAWLAFNNVKWATAPYTEQKFPNGLARFFDLTWLGHHPPSQLTQYVVMAFLALYVVGLVPALGLLPLAFFATLIGTLINSQGAINHSWQMVTMMLLAQLIVYAWPRKTGTGWQWTPLWKPDLTRHRHAAQAALVVIAASYVVCGVVKIVNSGGLWLNKAPYLAVQLFKTHYNHFYDTLNMPPEWLQGITEFLVSHPNIARLVFGSGLLIELLGFVILISRRWSFIGGIAIIALHLSISRLMNLNFEAHMLAALIYCVNLPGLAKTWRGDP